MTTQMTIEGEEVKVETDTRETELIVEKFPAAKTDPGLFFFLVLKHRHPWVAQLDEHRQNELRRYCYDIESLRRRRQDVRAKDERAAAGLA
jgi:hypothetical protein